MNKDFTDRLARALKAHFAQVAEQSLNAFLGESGAIATIYYLGDGALQDPQVFEEKLKAIFGAGAETILKYILENMETSSQT